MKKLTKEIFIERAIKTHGEKFSYDKVVYFSERIKVKIICKEHGVFSQLPKNHVSLKQGCPVCYGNKKLTTGSFIEKANSIHNNKYDYSLTQYSGNKGKVEIICNKHGVFKQTATRHLYGDGCPKCSESKGEKAIRVFLENNNVNFESQKKFKECKNINPLPFDFFIIDKNLLIEYDGQQHFGKSKGRIFDFESIKRNDQIKNDFANDNGYKLVRIPYKKLNKINTILQTII